MATYTITTDNNQETALAYAFGNPQNIPGAPPHPDTQEAFLQQQVDANVFTAMMYRYARDANEALVKSLASIPEENRDQALAAIAAIVSTHGGEIIRTGEQPAPPFAGTLPEGPTPKRLPPSFRSQ